jgi:hypothetical protein
MWLELSLAANVLLLAALAVCFKLLGATKITLEKVMGAAHENRLMETMGRWLPPALILTGASIMAFLCALYPALIPFCVALLIADAIFLWVFPCWQSGSPKWHPLCPQGSRRS